MKAFKIALLMIFALSTLAQPARAEGSASIKCLKNIWSFIAQAFKSGGQPGENSRDPRFVEKTQNNAEGFVHPTHSPEKPPYRPKDDPVQVASLPSEGLFEHFGLSKLNTQKSVPLDRARYSPDSRWIGVELDDGRFVLFDRNSHQSRVFELEGRKIYSYEFSPTSDLLLLRYADEHASCCSGRTNGVQIIDLENGQIRHEAIPTPGNHSTAVFSPDGLSLLIESNSTGGDRWKVFDLAFGTYVGTELVKEMNTRKDGDYLLTLGAKGQVRVSRISTGEQIAFTQLDTDNYVYGDISAKSGLVMVYTMAQNVPILLDLKTLKRREVQLDFNDLPDMQDAHNPELSVDGKTIRSIFFRTSEKFEAVWDTRTGRRTKQPALEQSPRVGQVGPLILTHTAFQQGVDKSLYVGTEQNPYSQILGERYAWYRGFLSVQIAPDGRSFFYIDKDKSLRLYEWNGK